MGFLDRIFGEKEKAEPRVNNSEPLSTFDDLMKQISTTKRLSDVHFEYLNLVNLMYSRREEPEARDLFKKLALAHIEKFSSIRRALLRDFKIFEVEPGHYQYKDGRPSNFLHVPTFEYLATVYTEDGEYEKAIEVCEKAIAFGLHDWTKSDYAGRIERIKKKAQKSKRAD